MTESLKERYDMKPEDLPPYVYAQTTQTDDIARFGKLVIDAAQDGDAMAMEILDRAGRELASAVLAVARRLKMKGAFPVAYVGGAFRAGDVLLEPMRAAILAEAPQAQIAPPRNTPVEGAAQMAIRAAVAPRPSRSTAAISS
jgi:N-acetylglucosamine kinase-like BadF-type ATPase